MGRHCQVQLERFLVRSDGLDLQAIAALPAEPSPQLPSVQIHHGGGGFDAFYQELAVSLAQRGALGVALIHRGYPGSGGQMEYGKGEIDDIGALTAAVQQRYPVDPQRMGIVGYSRGGHSTLLALERYSCFRAGVVWSAPVEMRRHVRWHPWIQEIIGGTPEEVPHEYACRSPLAGVARIGCPLLIVHGAEDEVVPVVHAHLLAEALDACGREAELEVLPGEGHSWSSAGLRTVWRRTLDFLQRHLDWGP